MIINGVDYANVPITFNTVCKMEDMGISLTEMEGRAMSTVRAYAAICMGADVEAAGRAIEEHIISGGNVADIVGAFGAEMEKSGFFQALAKQAATAKGNKKRTAKTGNIAAQES